MIEAGPEGATEAVVFVHGNPGSSHDWDALVDATGEFARAVAIDMPGFGQADKPASFDYNVSGYAAFLQGAFEELGITRVHLVVHDFGGPFGLVWGLQHPDAWASVVLINIGVLPGYTWHKAAQRWRKPVLGELTQLWIPRAGWRRAMQNRKMNPKGLPPAFVDQMYDNYDRGTRRAVLKLYRATPDPGDAAAEMGKAIKALNKPALAVWGMADPFLPGKYADQQREFFDVKDVVKIEGAGHWVFQDSPEAVRDAVIPFLREQLPS
ncbi:MAG TPA: alpha/beta hydrolase [Thermoleophilaceae bacterium]|jgi:pimeloyl-ACP methyl ester carboxylesterase